MEVGRVVRLKTDNKDFSADGIKKGCFGVVVAANNGLTVLFVNESNIGDYAIRSVDESDLEITNEVVPNEYLYEIEKMMTDSNRASHTSLKSAKFKEYDEVEVIVEKDIYAKEGVYKGMQGTIIEKYAMQSKWYVIFTDMQTGCDIADICIDECDIKPVQ